ncbi:MAG: hypothetical protein ACUVRP_06145 [Chlorobiales bacterium]
MNCNFNLKSDDETQNLKCKDARKSLNSESDETPLFFAVHSLALRSFCSKKERADAD